MDANEIAELRRVAERYRDHVHLPTTADSQAAARAFIGALTPDTVLALLDRLAAAEGEVARLNEDSRIHLMKRHEVEAERVARAEAARSVLAEFDTWTPYDSRDTGETFLAESVRDLVADIRRALDGEAT